MDRLGNSRVHWRYYRDNLTLLDEAEAVREVSAFRVAGGDSLVDATSIGIGRDPLARGADLKVHGAEYRDGGQPLHPVLTSP